MTTVPISEIPNIIDPNCDYDHPKKITFEDIKSAQRRLGDQIQPSQCERSRMCDMYGMDLWLKKEYQLFTGSFKEHGARNAILAMSDKEKQNGIIAASAGNHAQAVSFAGLDLSIPITVVMPTVAPLMKIQRCRTYGANVIVQGADMAESKKIAQQIAKERNMAYLNGYDHPEIIAGAGCIGLEILEQVENVEVVVVPIGGGGLFCGIALAIKGLNKNVKIVGVETTKTAGWAASLAAKKPTYTEMSRTLADGLSVPMVGANAFHNASKLEDKHIVVDEDLVAIAILRLAELEKAVVEGAGATALAAVISGQLDEYKGKRIVLVVSGGNIDTLVFSRCLDRALVAERRIVRFIVTIPDKPGGFLKLFEYIALTGASVKEITYDRVFVKEDVFSVQVQLVMEVRDREHEQEIVTVLAKNYKNLIYPVQYVTENKTVPVVKSKDNFSRPSNIPPFPDLSEMPRESVALPPSKNS